MTDKKDLDSTVEGLIREESAQTQAVKSLITVGDRDENKVGTDIELKTDLDKNQVCIHTAVDMMTNILNLTEQDFGDKCIIGNLITIKERKLLSKDRKSRLEIVEVARSPELVDMQSHNQQGFVKSFFSSKKNNQRGI